MEIDLSHLYQGDVSNNGKQYHYTWRYTLIEVRERRPNRVSLLFRGLDT